MCFRFRQPDNAFTNPSSAWRSGVSEILMSSEPTSGKYNWVITTEQNHTILPGHCSDYMPGIKRSSDVDLHFLSSCFTMKLLCPHKEALSSVNAQWSEPVSCLRFTDKNKTQTKTKIRLKRNKEETYPHLLLNHSVLIKDNVHENVLSWSSSRTPAATEQEEERSEGPLNGSTGPRPEQVRWRIRTNIKMKDSFPSEPEHDRLSFPSEPEHDRLLFLSEPKD